MQIITLKVGPLETNCYILAVDGKAAVIDPGGDSEEIISQLTTHKLTVDYILNTHGHHDHVLANPEIAAFAKKDIHIHPADEHLLQASQSIFLMPAAEKDYATKPLADKQKLDLAGEEILVMYTPGHTKGSVSFLVSGNLFCGDLLFKQSIGRTDLEGSSPKDMIESLKKVMNLDRQTKIYPGHGGLTTIGAEIDNNPFIVELNL